jgi:hypothetical protein
MDIFYFILPLILSAFTHFWNSADYPSGPSNDEGIYIRRALSVLFGFGPQESLLYDHPFFSQIFLAGIFSLINYPHFINSSIDNVDSVRMLFLVPRLIMAIISLVDTALVYLISRYWYNNKIVAFTASTLFAVLPFTDYLRRVLLEPIQLPFLLLSILFAICSAKINMMNTNNCNNKRVIFYILPSGIFLGLAIFTKIPAFTMIPLIAYIVYRSNNIKKLLFIWFIPVILVPLFWPAYALYKNQLNLWFKGIYFQTHRGAQTLFETIKSSFQYDTILLSLGTIGIVFSIIKRDLFILLWCIPFLVFLYSVGFVSYWHVIPLFPLFCIAASRLIYELSLFIRKKNIRNTLPFVVLLGVSVYSLYGYSEAIVANNSSDNSSHFKAIAFLDRYLYDKSNDKIDQKDSIVLISNPFYSWIPKYVFDLKNITYVDYYDGIAVKANKVIMLLDPQWEYRAKHNMLDFHMIENYNLYGKNKIATFGGSKSNNNNTTNYNYDVAIYAFDSQNPNS